MILESSVEDTEATVVSRARTSLSILLSRAAETDANSVVAAFARLVMALFKSPSAAWKALTISVNESRAAGSTLLRMLLI